MRLTELQHAGVDQPCHPSRSSQQRWCHRRRRAAECGRHTQSLGDGGRGYVAAEEGARLTLDDLGSSI